SCRYPSAERKGLALPMVRLPDVVSARASRPHCAKLLQSRSKHACRLSASLSDSAQERSIKHAQTGYERGALAKRGIRISDMGRLAAVARHRSWRMRIILRNGSAAPHSNWSPTVKAPRYSPPI